MSAAAEVHVMRLPPALPARWDEFVSACPSGTLFHTTAWMSVLQTGGAAGRPVIVAAFRGDDIVGGCVFLERHRLAVSSAVMPLLTPYQGYLVRESVSTKFSDRASERAEILGALAGWMSANYGREVLVMGPDFDDPRPLIQAGYHVSPRFTYHLDLTLSAEQLRERFDGHVRRQIAKGGRSGLTECSLEPDAGFRLLQATFEKRGEACPVPSSLFREIVTTSLLGTRRTILAASLGGNLASFVILLSDERTVYYAIAATDPAVLSTGISSWMIWKALEQFAGQGGPSRFDFVGANIPSIARFKEGFNPVLVPCWKLERASTLPGRLLDTLVRLRG